MRTLLIHTLTLVLCSIGQSGTGQAVDSGHIAAQATVLEAQLDTTQVASTKLEILGQLAELYELNNTDLAIAYWEQAYAICASNRDTLCMARQALGMIYHLINSARFDRALKMIDLTAQVYATDSLLSAQIWNRRGFYHQRRGEFLQALTSYYRSLQLFEALGHPQVADVRMRLGLLFYQLEKYDKALEFLEGIISNCEELGQCNTYVSALFYAGRIHLILRNHDQVVEYLTKSYERRDPTKGLRPSAFIHWSKGLIEMARNNYDRADWHLRQALAMFSAAELQADASNMYLALGMLNSRQDDHGNAIDMYHQALTTAQEINGHTVILQAYKGLSDSYARTGDHKTALNYALAYQEMYAQRNVGLEARLIEREFELAEQRRAQEIAMLNSQRDIALLTTKRQRALRNSFIGISLMLLLILLLILWQLRQRRKAQRLLEEKNRIIDTSLHEKEDLLKEIHHRVKNNLQIVSSMLHLQGRHVKDAAVLDALRDSRNRVNSMALIHQNLYQEEHLKGIDMRKYLSGLTQSLINSYRVDTRRIGITTRVDPILLDIDTAIPIGLITNELITNSLKYAFDGGLRGEINVTLRDEEDFLFLSVADDGTGLPEDFDARKQNSYGYQLIHSLARKLKTEVHLQNSNGCAVEFHITNYQKPDHA